MTLYFITGNRNKYEEVKAVLGDVEQLSVDLPEIQSIYGEDVVREKIRAAFEHVDGSFIVEDTSLSLECLNGLPGPLIKWFMNTIGNAGIYDIAQKYGNSNAEVRVFIGHAEDKDNIHVFEGGMKGDIVEPVDESDFGWDPIFRPEGYDKSFAGFSKVEKNKISMRRLALHKLKSFLETKH